MIEPGAATARRRRPTWLATLRSEGVSPAAYRRVTAGAVWALGFIIVTGGAVRISGSGLGCPDWPTCASHRVVAPWQYHAMVEFVNRVITGAVSVAVILAVLGAVIRRPRRRDLVLLSSGLVLGVIGQIVLGGETVKHQLAPPFVMGHFLLSMLILWDAVVLHHRAGRPDGSRPVMRVPSDLVLATRLLPVAAGLVLVLGTVVTSSGPHGGDPKARRLPYALHDVARLHGGAVMLFLAFSVVALWALRRAGAGEEVRRRGETLLVALVVQGGIGYLQYFTGVPAWLVGLHIAGAVAVWVAVLRLPLALGVWVPHRSPAGAARTGTTRAPVASGV